MDLGDGVGGPFSPSKTGPGGRSSWSIFTADRAGVMKSLCSCAARASSKTTFFLCTCLRIKKPADLSADSFLLHVDLSAFDKSEENIRDLGVELCSLIFLYFIQDIFFGKFLPVDSVRVHSIE